MQSISRIAQSAIVLAGFALITTPVRAADITCSGADQDLALNWKVNCPTGVTLAGVTTAGSTISFTKQFTFKNLDPLTIHFIGPALADATDSTPQVFMNVTEEIKNGTTYDWWKFSYTINDLNNPAAVDTLHPRKAHFHFGAYTTSDPLPILPVPGIDDNGVYSGFAATADQNFVVSPGNTYNASILRMHDRVDPDPANAGKFLAMKFDLIEQPGVPEPGTLALLAGGMAVLFWETRRRKRLHKA
jgi:hypothetical protein